MGSTSNPPVLAGRIRGKLRTSGFILHRWTQFVGTVVEIDNDRVRVQQESYVEIQAEPRQLRKCGLRIGERVGVTLDDNDEIIIHRLGPIRELLRDRRESLQG